MQTLTARWFALLLLALLVLVPASKAQAPAQSAETARVIVKFRADAGVSRQALGEQGAHAVQRPQHKQRRLARAPLER